MLTVDRICLWFPWEVCGPGGEGVEHFHGSVLLVFGSSVASRIVLGMPGTGDLHLGLNLAS